MENIEFNLDFLNFDQFGNLNLDFLLNTEDQVKTSYLPVQTVPFTELEQSNSG